MKFIRLTNRATDNHEIIALDQIAHIVELEEEYTSDRKTLVTLKDGKEIIYKETLKEIEKIINKATYDFEE